MDERRLKPFQSLLAVFLSGVALFFVAPAVFRGRGHMGVFGGEVLILLVAVLVPVFSGVSLRNVFPVRKIHLQSLFGVLIMWGALMVMSLAGMMWFLHFYPDQASAADAVRKVGEGMPFGMAVLGIAIMPAFCEEALFRGTIFAGLKDAMPDGLVILLVGMVFGAFHGSALRFIPTAALGMLFTYILLKTENILYTGFLHFVNNMLPVLIMQKGFGTGGEEISELPHIVLPVYTFWAGCAVIFLGIGKVLLERGEGRYTGKVFARGTQKVFAKAFLLGAACFLLALYALLYM